MHKVQTKISIRPLLPLLKKRRVLLASVESCTGGLLASAFTDVPGASSFFWGGWVCYDLSAKHQQLGVPKATLSTYGPYSHEVVRAMAEAGLAALLAAKPKAKRTTLCLATSGIAGPTGGTRATPVGTCYIALAATGHPTRTVRFCSPSSKKRAKKLSRQEHRVLFCNAVFDLLKQHLTG